ncbi:hypothetical protein F4810DRAFT_667490 [Camillea tinctor]|nr:hypothetical protein F4810DRAFT_667490 [Camillea tinctor]
MAPQDPWDPIGGLANIATGLGLKGYTPPMQAFIDITNDDEFESLLTAEMVTFMSSYPWREAWNAVPEAVINKALHKYTNSQHQLIEPCKNKGQLIEVDGQSLVVPFLPTKPEDYLVMFACRFVVLALKKEAEAGAEAMAWFPKKNLRHLLYLSYAFMHWLYLEQLTPEDALAQRNGGVFYWPALLSLRVSLACPECCRLEAGYQRGPLGSVVCVFCPRIERDWNYDDEELKLW